ncbi:hypothetical protein RR48_04960 [Papilio machaon]|uniref:Uncharacterized protein n=1 Tax=Papilio machaon TaxID=76193 RepID=A0A0N1I567_PAPMA|nr:hypothetical protein RR48_04960 [Papilio machaon]
MSGNERPEVPHMTDLEAKTFSLNEAIAEEVRGKQSLQTTPRSNSADIFKAELKEDRLPVLSRNKFLSKPYIRKASPKKVSSVQYKNTFKIRTPVRPTRLKRQQRLLNKFKYRTTERSIDSYEAINHKYIPLFKSLSMLFDNFLNADGSDSYETTTRNKYRRNYQYSKEDHEPKCACTFTPNANIKETESTETTITPTTSIPTEIPNEQIIASAEATAAPTDYTTAGYIRSFKRNKNIPLLLTRNTASPGRDDNGVREGSDSTIHGSIERYLTGDNGDNECVSRNEESESIAQYYEEHSYSTPRDYASSTGSSGGISRNRNGTRNTKTGRSVDKSIVTETEENSYEKLRRNVELLKGKNKLKTREYEAKSSTVIPNDNSGLRRNANKEIQVTESTVTDKDCKESDFSVTVVSADDKRFPDRNGAHTEENQKIRRTNEAVTSKFPFNTMATINNKVPVVTIFDGYSVAKDFNGENKLTEKAILIHA